MCAAIAFISACLFAGVDFRTSTTGSYSVFRGSTAKTETVVISTRAFSRDAITLTL